MRDLRRFLACALGACLCASPAIVVAQHGAEAKPAEHAAPAAKHEPAAETKAAGHGVKAEPAKAADAKPKETAKTAKAEPAAKADATAEHKSEPAKKGETAAKHEPEGKASAKAEGKEKPGESADKSEPKDAKTARVAKADGPRVTVTRVDETTGAAKGAAKPVANSKLEAALGRISERIDDARKEPARAASAKSANRIRLSWRTTLDWPEELGAAAPEPQMPAPPAAQEEPPDKDHVALVWE